jgi:Zn-dependent protease
MSDTWLLEGIAYLIPWVLSLSVHEWAHAYSAYKLGDDTAERMGRMTLNPLVHIDPIGTILLPLMQAPLAWAKPVPVNPTRFDRRVHMRTGMMLTAAAGPASNVVLALLCAILLGLGMRFAPEAYVAHPAVERLLLISLQLNLALAIFNMLPIVPLDGSRVADWLVPLRMRPAWEKFSQYGPLVLIALVLLPVFGGTSLIGWPMRYAMGWAIQLVSMIATA